jgi:hypothetical protein
MNSFSLFFKIAISNQTEALNVEMQIPFSFLRIKKTVFANIEHQMVWFEKIRGHPLIIIYKPH